MGPSGVGDEQGLTLLPREVLRVEQIGECLEIGSRGIGRPRRRVGEDGTRTRSDPSTEPVVISIMSYSWLRGLP